MTHDIDGHDDQGLVKLGSTPNSDSIADYYDRWAGSYNADLADWSYDAPAHAAALLAASSPLNEPVLDVGCGTGLTGLALRAAGFTDVRGVDISTKSIALAQQTGAYSDLVSADLQSLPLPYGDASVSGMLCIGVLTYVPDTHAILEEFCRICRPSGCTVFTQRDDLFQERGCADILAAMEADGRWQKISISPPMPYLPGNEEFAEQIQVIYCSFRVA